eukprot:726637_1
MSLDWCDLYYNHDGCPYTNSRFIAFLKQIDGPLSFEKSTFNDLEISIFLFTNFLDPVGPSASDFELREFSKLFQRELSIFRVLLQCGMKFDDACTFFPIGEPPQKPDIQNLIDCGGLSKLFIMMKETVPDVHESPVRGITWGPWNVLEKIYFYFPGDWNTGRDGEFWAFVQEFFIGDPPDMNNGLLQCTVIDYVLQSLPLLTQPHWELLQKSNFLRNVRLSMLEGHAVIGQALLTSLLLLPVYRAAAASIMMDREIMPLFEGLTLSMDTTGKHLDGSEVLSCDRCVKWIDELNRRDANQSGLIALLVCVTSFPDTKILPSEVRNLISNYSRIHSHYFGVRPELRPDNLDRAAKKGGKIKKLLDSCLVGVPWTLSQLDFDTLDAMDIHKRQRERMPNPCANCGTFSRDTHDGRIYRVCKGCRQAWYCSENCQQSHWILAHKSFCKSRKTTDANSKAKQPGRCSFEQTRESVRCSFEPCGSVEFGARKFQYCSRCRKAAYCSKMCQRRDWKRAHRTVCEQRK